MPIDIHTHLAQYGRDEIGGIVARARMAGVSAILVAGTTLADSRVAVELARQYGELHACVGLHPQDLNADSRLDSLDELRTLARDRHVVAISEIGLDAQPASVPMEVQKPFFENQLQIARELNLPVVFHSRDTGDTVLDILAGFRGLRGAAHYFQGDANYAQALIKLGWHISLAKPLLRLGNLQRVAKGLNLESIVLETDSYPQPFKRNRTKWTEPQDLPKVSAKLAELQGLSVEVVNRATDANSISLFNIVSQAV